jgi:hypothetical protein
LFAATRSQSVGIAGSVLDAISTSFRQIVATQFVLFGFATQQAFEFAVRDDRRSANHPVAIY